MEVGGQLHTSGALSPERALVPIGRGWIGTGVGVDGIW